MLPAIVLTLGREQCEAAARAAASATVARKRHPAPATLGMSALKRRPARQRCVAAAATKCNFKIFTEEQARPAAAVVM